MHCLAKKNHLIISSTHLELVRRFLVFFVWDWLGFLCILGLWMGSDGRIWVGEL